MALLSVVQPYIPNYRLPFFQALSRSLGEKSIALSLIAGSPDQKLGRRGDQADFEGLIFRRRRTLHFGGRRVTISTTIRDWIDSDGVIVGLEGSSLDTNLAVIARRKGIRVGLWGHVGTYVNTRSKLDAVVERWQLRNCDQVFAYTESGAAVAEACNVESDRVTVVRNSTDTRSLLLATNSITPRERANFRDELHVGGECCFGYLGGLDSSKRIDFLAEVLDELWELDPRVHLLVGGRGDQEHLLEAASTRGQVKFLGHVSAERKALLFDSSTLMLMPGRVGLVAVDALASRVPILTRRDSFHAPELDYLREGESLWFSTGTPREFALTALDLSGSQAADADIPSIESMVKNFTNGVERMLNR